MQGTLQKKSVFPILLLIAAVILLLIPLLQSLADSITFPSFPTNRQGFVYFKTGTSTSGVRPSEKVAEGYSQTSLEYSIVVEGTKSCSGIKIGLRLTGYGWQRKRLNECTQGALVTALEEMFNKMTEKFRGNNTAVQNTIEDTLFDDFMWDLPEIVSTLK